MLFNSLDFLIFLAVAVVLYWTIVRLGNRAGAREGAARLRLLMIFVASCVFYMAWNPAYIVLILFSTALDYVAGRQIHASEQERTRKAWLMVSLVANLGLLGVFKYFNFFNTAIADTARVLFHARVEPAHLDVLLPVGISFYTFQTLSYTIDIYRRRLTPTSSFLKFAFYVTFFPQLVAGPIVRASEFLPQIDKTPRLTRERVGDALFLIGTGLIKKVIFADYISVNLVDRVFDDPSLFTAPEVVIALYGFTLQIYADFSGYTDVARGAGKLFGFELPENFERPYKAPNIAEFWRRWHMTLSSWLRDYLYFPLGGSKGSAARTYLNLWLTIFLIGIWHGASWTFVVYGALQAFCVTGHRVFVRTAREVRSGARPERKNPLLWPFVLLIRLGPKKKADALGREEDPFWLYALKVLITMQFVVFSRILFRATSWQNAEDLWGRLFSATTSVRQVSGGVWAILLLGFFFHYLPSRPFELLRERFVRAPAPVQGLILVAVGALTSYFATSEVVPYIYFQF